MIANRRGQGKGWILVDTGPKGSAKPIINMAETLFGYGTKPEAIVLTHGHSDHAGSVEDLLQHWKVPVYAHELELPYLTGRSSYPPVDPTVGGGLMSLLSPFFSLKPVNLGKRVKWIDLYHGIPELPEWRFIHTPGHSPGHISLFLPLNTTMIAGDALATTKAESAIYLFGYFKELSGPPAYITTDWAAAAASVRKIVELEPRVIASGHGPVMRSKELQVALQDLAENFEGTARPGSGRYISEPAIADETGVTYIPPFKTNTRFNVVVGLSAALLTFGFMRTFNK